MSWLARLRNVFRPDVVSAELDREMAFHLAERAEALEAQGMDPAAAKQEARRRFGNYGLLKEDTRGRDILVWLDTLLADLRYAVRALRKSSGFALVATLSLALGIGANTAIFTLIDVAMLRSLPVRNPEELVWLTHDGSLSKSPSSFTQALWEQIRDHQDVFTGIFAYGSTGTADLSSGGEARPISVGLVSGGFFSTLGVRPVAGRTLTDADDYKGCPGVAVITHRFWRSEYGGSESVIGKPVAINGHPFQILGVAEPEFFGVEAGYYPPIWAPQCAGTILRGANYQGGGSLIGRPKPGVTLEAVRARMAGLAPGILEATLPADLPAEAAAQYRKIVFSAVPFATGLPGLRADYGEALLILMGVVGVVLLIACANIANLLLARATARQREIAVRLALGASRLRLIRQLLTESLLLSLSGAAFGLLFAAWGSRVLAGFLLRPQQMISLDLSPDLTVLTFSIAVGILTGVLFGLAPAWRAVRVDPHTAMKPGGRGVAEGHSRFRAGKALVVAQTALSLVMIACAGLLLGSWRRLATIDPGFRSEGVLLAGVNTRRAQVPGEQLGAIYAGILERLRALPGVVAASAADRTPIGHTNWTGEIEVEGIAPTSGNDTQVQLNRLSEGYFSTIGASLLAGRDFNRGDGLGSPPVAIVSQETVRRFFPDVPAIGRHFRFRYTRGFSAPFEIIGIAINTKEFDLREASQPIVYLALSQDSIPESSFNFALRTEGPPAALGSGVKAVLAEIDPRFSLELRTLKGQIDDSLKLPRAIGMLAGFFGALALLLASIGLYGTMAYTVSRRRNEIGVRIALGAAQARIVRMVLGDVGRMVGAGIVIGIGLSLAVTRLVAAFLYGVEPNDPATLSLSALALVAVGLGAALLPARRAARLDPVAALRDE